MEKDSTSKPRLGKTQFFKAAYSFPDWTGKDLGEFTVEKLIGSGGMAVVYQGVQKNLQRKVAIKVLPPALSQQETFQKLFIQEATVLANLYHANIVPIYSYGQFENCPYFTMELIQGKTLRENIDNRRRTFFRRKTLFPIPDVLRWTRQIALALEYAHNKGVVHRDIKPSNIVVDDFDRVFVMDFGLVRVFQLAQVSQLPCGTPGYMSYEQTAGMEVDGRTDIYSLGCLMYELLTGKPVSEAQSVVEALANFEKGPPTPPASVSPSIPVLLDQIIVKALEKERKNRYQSMSEFLAVLERFMSGKLQARLDTHLHVREKTLKQKAQGPSARLFKFILLLVLLGGITATMALPWIKQWRQSRRAAADDWCKSQWQIAQNYRNNRMKELAAQTYQKIIDRYPRHPIAEKARELLRKLEEIL